MQHGIECSAQVWVIETVLLLCSYFIIENIFRLGCWDLPESLRL